MKETPLRQTLGKQLPVWWAQVLDQALNFIPLYVSRVKSNRCRKSSFRTQCILRSEQQRMEKEVFS